jgi:hypothetical protein
MGKIFLALLIILFVLACSSDWEKKPAPAYNPVTSDEVR